MTILTSTATVSGLLPEEIGALVVQPVQRLSVAMQAALVVPTTSHTFRVPIVVADPTAEWSPEGEEITPTDATLDELDITPKKVAALTIISRELAEDSSPAAQTVVGDGLARDLARKIDLAFFAHSTSNGPDGLLSADAVQVVDLGSGITNTDPFAEALSKAEDVGAQLASFLANPADVLTMAKIKKETDSNEPLLGNDPTKPTQRTILGVPLISTPAITSGDIWGVPRAKVFVVLREGTTLAIDSSAYFSSDRIGIRATMRVGFAFPHQEAIIRLTKDGS